MAKKGDDYARHCYICRMRLMYIYHSGYVIEADGYAIVFDYFKDTGDAPRSGYIHETLLKREGPLYVFASHFHPDHFNPDILLWKQQKEDIRFIFSQDILDNKKAKANDAVYVDKGDLYQDELLTVRVFGSTDVGVSFLVDTAGKRLFHAGDLNNWHWKDESTPQEAIVAENNFLHELDDIAKEAPLLDVAMFPVDPRLGSDYARGAEQFIAKIETTVFAPMHFAEWYDKLTPFEAYAEARGVRFAAWTAKGESLDF